jgi:hypothetical protein
MPIEIRELHIKVAVKDADAEAPAELPPWEGMQAVGADDAVGPLPDPLDHADVPFAPVGWADDAFGLS